MKQVVKLCIVLTNVDIVGIDIRNKACILISSDPFGYLHGYLSVPNQQFVQPRGPVYLVSTLPPWNWNISMSN